MIDARDPFPPNHLRKCLAVSRVNLLEPSLLSLRSTNVGYNHVGFTVAGTKRRGEFTPKLTQSSGQENPIAHRSSPLTSFTGFNIMNT